MKIRWDPSNTRLLITSVEVRPALWDTTLDDYSKKNITLTKWEEVAEELGCSGKFHIFLIWVIEMVLADVIMFTLKYFSVYGS